MRRGLADWALSELCKVTTDTGLVGWGETLPHYTWGVVTDASVERAMRANPADLLWDDTLGAGLQQALFDLVGKSLGVPAHRLMGAAVRARCPLAWWCYDMPPHDWAEEARAGIEAGYTAFKLKARPWFDIVEQVEAVSAATPAHAKLDLDFNGLLVDSGHAKPLLTTLASYPKVAIFETPIPQTDVGGNRSLRSSVPRPIAMHFDSPPFLTAVKEDVCDGFVVSGGAATCLHQGAQAAAANMPLWLQLVGTGITTAFAMHLGAVLPAARWPAITCLNTYAHHLLTEPLLVEHGYMPAPQATRPRCDRGRRPRPSPAAPRFQPDRTAAHDLHRPLGRRAHRGVRGPGRLRARFPGRQPARLRAWRDADRERGRRQRGLRSTLSGNRGRRLLGERQRTSDLKLYININNAMRRSGKFALALRGVQSSMETHRPCGWPDDRSQSNQGPARAG